jgi:lipid A 3-O-deacylase
MGRRNRPAGSLSKAVNLQIKTPMRHRACGFVQAPHLSRRRTASVFGVRLSELCLLLTWTATAAHFDLGPVLAVQEENDLVVRTDRHYTQGIKFSYLHTDDVLPGFLRRVAEWLPEWGYSARVARYGFQIGQSIYTPEEIMVPTLIPDDRPYAGWLYGGLILHRRGFTGARFVTLESFDLQVGIMGPQSLGEEAQTWMHEIRDLERPRGWDHQIKTEPGIALRYWRGVRFSTSVAAERYFDIIPHAAFSLGNVETSLRVGTAVRFGFNLPDNFGVPTISSLVAAEGGRSRSLEDERWSVYAFAEFESWAVAHSASLDGNLYHNSHHVSKEPLVFESKGGFALGFRYAEFGLAYVFRSREFRRQDQDNSYGSVFLKAKF